MRRTLLGLGLALLVPAERVFSQPPAPEGRPRIALFWADYELLSRKLSSGARNAVERETRSIFEGAGIDVLFYVGSPEDWGRTGAHEIRVVLLARSAEAWRLPPRAMGAILEKTRREGTVYLFVPAIERSLGISLDRGEMVHDGRTALALARALGRVLAHETVHAIDPEIAHGPEGSLMSENLTTEHLLSHRLALHPTTAKRLVDRLARRGER